jgi:Cu-processing system permease protein
MKGRLPDPRTCALLARHELRIVLRSRWVAVYAGLFALLAAAVSYFGLTVIEFTGFQSFDRTAVSLLNLVLYLVPLATMLMAVQSFRSEGGMTEQLMAEPVTRVEVALGKLAGLGTAHVTATLLGFGFSGVVIGAKVGVRGLSAYLVLVGFTMLLGAVFLALASFLTILAGRGLRAYAAVLVAWFVFVLLFDLTVIGLTFVLPEAWATRLAIAGVVANPIDAARVATLLAIAGKELFGAAGAQLVRSLGGVGAAIGVLTAVLVAWLAVPAAAGMWALNRRDL